MRATLRNMICAGVFAVAVASSGVRADEPKGLPKFKQAWELEVPADTVRIATADVMGDKKYHLLTLGKDGVLTIHDVTGEKPKEAGKVELGKMVNMFVAGNFIKDKPAMIVVEGAYFVRGEDGKYTKTIKNTLRPINGYVRPYDKSETVFSMGVTNEPKEFVFEMKGDKIEVSDKTAADPSQAIGYYQMLAARLPEEAAKRPIPKGMLLGGLNLFGNKGERATNILTIYVEEKKQSLSLYDFAKIFGDPETNKPIWTGDEIKGKILDFFVGSSPKDAKQTGALVLTETGTETKKRMVTFYAKE